MEQKIDSSRLLNEIRKSFEDAGIDEIADAEWIMTEVLGCSRSMIPFFGEVDEIKLQKIYDAVQKRISHIPLAYIFGHSDFCGYDFNVTNDTLIPRIDTEVLIEKLVESIKSKFHQPKVLDIGTGTGAIAIVVSKETNSKVTAVDVSKKALEVAKSNAVKNDADVEFVHSNLFENLTNRKFDIIVSNPPYIETEVIESLSREVKENEPILALDGGEDGLDFYRKIVEEAPKHLEEHGMLFFEIGFNQGEAVANLMKKDFKNIEVIKDYGNNDRVVLGELLWLKG